MNIFCIYYEGGSTFSNEQGTPYDAPKTSVEVIAVASEELGTRFVFGDDFFYYEPERITDGFEATNIHGMHDHLVRARRQCVFFGRNMLTAEFQRFLSSVKEKYPKSALSIDEARRGVKLEP